MKEARETFYDLELGILLIGAVFAGIGFLAAQIPFGLGIVFGVLVAAGLAFHMYKSLAVTLDLPPDQAERHGRNQSALRIGLMALAVVFSMFFPGIFHAAGVVLGILTLKCSAYLQPIIRRFITNKIYSKGR